MELIDHLKQLNVKVWLEGERVRLRAPKGVITPELHEKLRERRTELVTFLTKANEWAASQSSLIPIQPNGSRPPFFGVPGHNGDVFSLVPLSRSLGMDQPFYAFQPPGVDGKEAPLTRIEDLAKRFVDELRAFQPAGPYRVGGYCTGGLVAFEAAHRLVTEGENVDALILLGTSAPTSNTIFHRVRIFPVSVLNRTIRLFRERVHGVNAEPRRDSSEHERPHEANRDCVERATIVAARRYRGHTYPGSVVLFLPSDNWRGLLCERYLDWGKLATELKVYTGPTRGVHRTMLREPSVQRVAELLKVVLR